jgi:malonate transporter and related proteins
MSALTSIVLPVFVVLGLGYVLTWMGYFSDTAIDALMKFAQGFAIPCLLFQGIAYLDLSQSFELPLLVSFYFGALSGFTIGTVGARFLFGRSWEDSVAIGFVGLFSNSVLLGLPITERAYGSDALAGNFAIIAMHAPFCYAVGISTMEFIKARGEGMARLPVKVLKAMFSNPLIVGITLGLLFNLSGLAMSTFLRDALGLIVRAALPVALFGLGGVLYRYRPEGDMRAILFIVSVSLVLHPTVTYLLGRWNGLSDPALRSAVMTAAMAPGVSAYLFADLYGNARRVAASAVLLGTGLTILTATAWIAILP